MLYFSKEDNLLLLPFLTELEVIWLLGEEIINIPYGPSGSVLGQKIVHAKIVSLIPMW